MEHQLEICHGTWVPQHVREFDNPGQFVFWVETPANGNGSLKPGLHPSHLHDAERLSVFLASDLKLGAAATTAGGPEPGGFSVTMPSVNGKPLPSREMAQLSGEYLPDDFEWSEWEISGIVVRNPLSFLRELQFLAGFAGNDFRIGHDLKFWIQFAQQLRVMVRQHQFLPVMKCSQPSKGRSQPKYVAGWAPADSLYERSLRDFAIAMPAVCTLVGKAGKAHRNGKAPVSVLDRTDLLRQFSEQQVDLLVSGTPFTRSFLKPLGKGWFAGSLAQTTVSRITAQIEPPNPDETDVAHWHAWQRKILHQARRSGFSLGFRLSKDDGNDDNRWRIGFFVSCNEDPSLSFDLSEWWPMPERVKGGWRRRFGDKLERDLLVSLGQAGRICPLLWQGMETAKPIGVDLDPDPSYRFLKEAALVLESAVYRIVRPSSWPPNGRQRPRLRV